MTTKQEELFNSFPVKLTQNELQQISQAFYNAGRFCIGIKIEEENVVFLTGLFSTFMLPKSYFNELNVDFDRVVIEDYGQTITFGEFSCCFYSKVIHHNRVV